MNYSEKLNGFWEEGYHYYLEIRDDRLTVRGYRRDITLETKISYDAAALDRGERAVISLEDNVLSRTFDGDPFTMIRELAYENGELKLLYYYTIMGETLYTLKKVENGPFDHIIIRDGEFLEKLQGRWEEWRPGGKTGSPLTIDGDKLFMLGVDGVRIHVVSYKYDRESVYIVPANLIDSDFGSYTRIEVEPDMLTTRMIVYDASMPLSVFARADMLDKIKVPSAAREPIRNTMTYMPNPSGPMNGFLGMGMFTGGGTPSGEAPEPVKPEQKPESPKSGAGRCPCCGYELGPDHGKFCPECGSRLV